MHLHSTSNIYPTEGGGGEGGGAGASGPRNNLYAYVSEMSDCTCIYTQCPISTLQRGGRGFWSYK